MAGLDLPQSFSILISLVSKIQIPWSEVDELNLDQMPRSFPGSSWVPRLTFPLRGYSKGEAQSPKVYPRNCC